MITRTFKLCLNAGTGSAPYINVNQYDEGETWLFELYTEQGERYMPTTGAIVGIKSDGKGIANTGTVDSNGRVVITETEQMTASAGLAIFELSIDGLTHGTANFAVQVERKPTDDAIMSDSDYSMFQEAIDAAEVINDVIGDGDPSEVIGEHVDAWLDSHPEATTTVLDGAITAPKINNSLWDKILVNEEASGNPASFEDGADDVPVSSLKVALEPVQLGSGDPSPTNIRPISGQSTVTVDVVGRNLFGGLITTTGTQYGVTYTANLDGTFTVNGTNNSSSVSDYRISGTGTYRLDLPVGNYVLNSGAYGTNGTGNTLYITIKDANNQIRYVGNNGTADSTFSIAEGEYIASSFIRFAANGTANNLVFKPMIRRADDTYRTYEPYAGNTYPYSLGREVYGGSVDLATGVLTVTKVCTTLTGNEGWSFYRSDGSTEYNGYRATAPTIFGGQVLEAWGTGTRSNAICSDYVCNDSLAYSHTGNAFIISAPSNSQIFVISTNQANTVENFKTYLANNAVQVCATLVEPQTIQLTPQEVKTLLGYNNISSTGTVDVIYHADTKLYVDKMTTVDNNIIAPTEADFVATRNYTVNDLLIVADTLYKVTANIASGSAITPNSNVQQTTLGALIKALS